MNLLRAVAAHLTTLMIACAAPVSAAEDKSQPPQAPTLGSWGYDVPKAAEDDPTGKLPEPETAEPVEPAPEPQPTPTAKPRPASPAVALPRETVSAIERADDKADLNSMGEWIVTQMQQASTPAEAEVYRAAGLRVIDRLERVEAAEQKRTGVSSAPPDGDTRRKDGRREPAEMEGLDIEKCESIFLCGMLIQVADSYRSGVDTSARADGDVAGEIAATIGRVAFDRDRPRSPSVEPSPATDRRFVSAAEIAGGSVAAGAFVPSRFYDPATGDRPRRSAPTAPARDGRIERAAPPSPETGHAASRGRKPQGVLLHFDLGALDAAVRHGFDPYAVEAMFLDARDGDDMLRRATAIGERSVDLLLGARAQRTVEGIVVVSLKVLADAAEPYADDWASLPDNLRRPGPMRRIHGFLLDPENEDILLLGVADGTGEAITLDEMIVGIDAFWRRGVSPMISLDPDPSNMGGPQNTRIVDLPADSLFARVMLEADYEMKHITLLGRGAEGIDFTPMLDRSDALAPGETTTNRFWFTPAEPRPGDVTVSPDGLLYLFDAGMILKTEEMLERGGMLIGSGSGSSISRDLAASFTRHLPTFEQRLPVIRRLHALMDVGMAASLWRLEEIDYTVLNRLASLPHKSVEIPASYPGIYKERQSVVGRYAYQTYVVGGVDMSRRRTLGWILPIRSPELEAALHEYAAGGGAVARALPEARLQLVAAPAGEEGAGTAGGDRDQILKGMTRIAGGAPEHAYLIASRLLAEDPFDTDAISLRAEAATMLGLYRLAERDLLRLRRSGTGEESARIALLRLSILDGRTTDFDTLSESDRATLAQLFISNAIARAAMAGSQSAANASLLQDLDIAIHLKPKEPAAYTLKAAQLMQMGDLEEAIAALEQADQLSPNESGIAMMRSLVFIRAERYAEAEEVARNAMATASVKNMIQFALMRGLARSCLSGTPELCAELKRGMLDLALRRQGMAPMLAGGPEP